MESISEFTDLISKGYNVVKLRRLKESYPKMGYFIAESEEVERLWEERLKRPLPDCRDTKGTRMIQQLDPKQLQYDVGPGTNTVFIDEDTMEVVGGTVYGLLDDTAIAEKCHGLTLDVVAGAMRSARKEDPGMIVQVGYSAGQRTKPLLGWARNLKRAADKDELLLSISQMFMFLWSRALLILPQAVIDDFEEMSIKLRGLHMDAGMEVGRNKDMTEDDLSNFSLEINGGQLEISLPSLAPPSGFCVKNYRRHVHNETNFHKYCVGFAPKREPEGLENGGNFFLAQHGVRMGCRSNQMCFWRGKDLHGTSLQKVDPADEKPPFVQTGMTFIVTNRILEAMEQLEKECDGSKGSNSAEGSSSSSKETFRQANPPPKYGKWKKEALLNEIARRNELGAGIKAIKKRDTNNALGWMLIEDDAKNLEPESNAVLGPDATSEDQAQAKSSTRHDPASEAVPEGKSTKRKQEPEGQSDTKKIKR